MYQEIGKHLDAGLETDLILLDFAKAFYSVCHKKLLQKLKWFGICGIHKYKERLRLYKRWPCSTYILNRDGSRPWELKMLKSRQ